MPTALNYSARDLVVAALTVYAESRGEPLEGQQGVAWVIRNRAAWKPSQWWGKTVQDVCLKPFQFSCWNANDPNYGLIHKWLLAGEVPPEATPQIAVCRAVFDGEVPDPTGGATHYEVLGTGAAWAKNVEFNKIIGRHAFYAIGPD